MWQITLCNPIWQVMLLSSQIPWRTGHSLKHHYDNVLKNRKETSCVFPTSSCKSVMKDTTSTQNFNVATKFPELLEVFSPNFVFLNKKFLDKSLKFRKQRRGNCPLPQRDWQRWMLTCSADVTAGVWRPCNAIDTGAVIVETCYRCTRHPHV